MKSKSFDVLYWAKKTGSDDYDYSTKSHRVNAKSELEAKQKAKDELGEIQIVRIIEK